MIGYIMLILALIHALYDAKNNRIQRLLMLITLFIYGFLLEYLGVSAGNYTYASETIMLFEIIPLSVTCAWVGIIYSIMLIGDFLELSPLMRIITTTLIALSIDWGMDPIAVELGAWTWTIEGQYYGIPGFNFIGWFFIPIAYLLPYEIVWNKEIKKVQLLTIKQIDDHQTLTRKLYTLLVIVPIAVGFLILVGIISRIPILYNMNVIALSIWAILTVVISAAIISWKRRNLNRKKLYELIPPIILLLLAVLYTFYGFFIGRIDLGFLMLLTGIPIWLIFSFMVLNKTSREK
ncbi:MAG: carotenoid biosynthesis protein [Candidatus Lokiarchaeota archaeon]|nr:carotenoid biosynthesis protein [Candidatus Lokiarchaeota archaeon]